MKKIIFFTIVIAVIITLLESCQKQPIASFSASSTSIKTNESVTFTNTSAEATSFQWDFGDGSTSNEKEPKHVYINEGNYVVTLFAFSKNGKNKNTTSITINVAKPAPVIVNPPTANFSVKSSTPTISDSTTIYAGASVAKFKDISTNSTTAWLWDMGDGTTENIQNPTHVFQNVGTYTVKLTVSNQGGSSTKTSVINAIMPPANLQGGYTVINNSDSFYNYNDNITINLLDSFFKIYFDNLGGSSYSYGFVNKIYALVNTNATITIPEQINYKPNDTNHTQPIKVSGQGSIIGNGGTGTKINISISEYNAAINYTFMRSYSYTK